VTDWKPEGYAALSPYLILRDPEATLAFAEACFGGERLRVIKDQQGRIRHGEIRLGEVVLMMGGGVSDWPAQDGHVHLYVPDVDVTYEQALALGAHSLQDPLKQSDPDRRAGVRDPGGLVWWIATQVDPE